MLDKNSKSDGKFYKSPTRKLFRFFEKSRDKWKAKCLEGKYHIKLLTNKIRYLEKRKADLKNMVKELEKELNQLKEKKRTNQTGHCREIQHCTIFSYIFNRSDLSFHMVCFIRGRKVERSKPDFWNHFIFS